MRHLVATVERLAAVLVTIDADHHLRGQLRIAVQHTARAEIRPAAGPNGTDAGGGQHGDDRMRRVGQAAHHAIARLDTKAAQGSGEATHLRAQLVPGHFNRSITLVEVDECCLAGHGLRHEVFGVVEHGTGEPFSSRHGALAKHGGGLRAHLRVEVFP